MSADKAIQLTDLAICMISVAICIPTGLKWAIALTSSMTAVVFGILVFS